MSFWKGLTGPGRDWFSDEEGQKMEDYRNQLKMQEKMQEYYMQQRQLAQMAINNTYANSLGNTAAAASQQSVWHQLYNAQNQTANPIDVTPRYVNGEFKVYCYIDKYREYSAERDELLIRKLYNIHLGRETPLKFTEETLPGSIRVCLLAEKWDREYGEFKLVLTYENMKEMEEIYDARRRGQEESEEDSK